MLIDLKKLFDNEGEIIFFSHDLDFSGVTQWGIKPFVTPVNVCGQAENKAGIVTIAYAASFTTEYPCDRCLETVRQDRQMQFSHTAVQKLNQLENDDYLVLPEGILDLDQQVISDILLELPNKVLCSEDCKGLCPHCGTNLNRATCGCQSDWKDSRFAVLDQLL